MRCTMYFTNMQVWLKAYSKYAGHLVFSADGTFMCLRKCIQITCKHEGYFMLNTSGPFFLSIILRWQVTICGATDASLSNFSWLHPWVLKHGWMHLPPWIANLGSSEIRARDLSRPLDKRTFLKVIYVNVYLKTSIRGWNAFICTSR